MRTWHTCLQCYYSLHALDLEGLMLHVCGHVSILQQGNYVEVQDNAGASVLPQFHLAKSVQPTSYPQLHLLLPCSQAIQILLYGNLSNMYVLKSMVQQCFVSVWSAIYNFFLFIKNDFKAAGNPSTKCSIQCRLLVIYSSTLLKCYKYLNASTYLNNTNEVSLLPSQSTIKHVFVYLNLDEY